MDIRMVNLVLEQSIAAFQIEEIEALTERFKVLSPMQMHRKYGMAVGATDDEVMDPIESALEPLVAGHGKLTDPNRTPEASVVRELLQKLPKQTEQMLPKYRKEVLSRLREWLKVARAHAKRLDQARQRTDITFGDVLAARKIRDLIDAARAAVSKQKGGGPGKKATVKEPKKRASRKSGAPTVYDRIVGPPPRAPKSPNTGPQIPDARVFTFIALLKGLLWSEAKGSSDRSYSPLQRKDYEPSLATVIRVMKPDMQSDDRDDLQDLLAVVRREFDMNRYNAYVSPAFGPVSMWIDMMEKYLQRGEFPHVPAGVAVPKKKVDKRQLKMFEALRASLKGLLAA